MNTNEHMTENRLEILQEQNQRLKRHLQKVQQRYEQKIAELSLVREFGMTLLHPSRFEIICRSILDLIIRNTVAQNCSIMLLDQEKGALFLAAASDPGGVPYIAASWQVLPLSKWQGW